MKKLARIEVRWSKKEGLWVVKAPKQAVWLSGTKAEAVAEAVKMAKSLEAAQVIICRKDGSYQEERTYPRSRDPRRSKG